MLSKYVNDLCLVVFGVWFRVFYFDVFCCCFEDFLFFTLTNFSCVMSQKVFSLLLLLFSELILYSDFSLRSIFHLHNYLKQ